MKKILEAILAINLAVLSCIVFINIILRYGFQTSILSVDELSRYLFVWLTFIGAIVAFMDNAHVQVTFLVEKLSPAITQTTPTEVRFWGVFCQEFTLAFRW